MLIPRVNSKPSKWKKESLLKSFGSDSDLLEVALMPYLFLSIDDRNYVLGMFTLNGIMPLGNVIPFVLSHLWVSSMAA